MQRAILMATAALCIQAITEADLAEMGEQVFMVGDPTDLPENPTKGSLPTLSRPVLSCRGAFGIAFAISHDVVLCTN